MSAKYKLRVIDYKKSFKNYLFKETLINAGEDVFPFEYIPRAKYESLIMIQDFMAEKQKVKKYLQILRQEQSKRYKVAYLDKAKELLSSREKTALLNLLYQENAVREDSSDLLLLNLLNEETTRDSKRSLSLSNVFDFSRKAQVFLSVVSDQEAERNSANRLEIIKVEEAKKALSKILSVENSILSSFDKRNDVAFIYIEKSTRHKSKSMNLINQKIQATKLKRYVDIVTDLIESQRKNSRNMSLEDSVILAYKELMAFLMQGEIFSELIKDRKSAIDYLDTLSVRNDEKENTLLQTEFLLAYKELMAFLMQGDVLSSLVKDRKSSIDSSFTMSIKDDMQALVESGIIISIRNKEKENTLLEERMLFGYKELLGFLMKEEVLATFVKTRESKISDYNLLSARDYEKENTFLDYLKGLAIKDNEKESTILETSNLSGIRDREKENTLLEEKIILGYKGFLGFLMQEEILADLLNHRNATLKQENNLATRDFEKENTLIEEKMFFGYKQLLGFLMEKEIFAEIVKDRKATLQYLETLAIRDDEKENTLLENVAILGYKGFLAFLMKDEILADLVKNRESLIQFSITSEKEDREGILELPDLVSDYGDKVAKLLLDFMFGSEENRQGKLEEIYEVAETALREGLTALSDYNKIIAFLDKKREGLILDGDALAKKVQELKQGIINSTEKVASGIIYDYSNFDFSNNPELYKGGYGVPEYYESDNPFNLYYPWNEQLDVQESSWVKFGGGDWEIDSGGEKLICQTSGNDISGYINNSFDKENYRIKLKFKVADPVDKGVGLFIKYFDSEHHIRFTINGGDTTNALQMSDYMELVQVVNGIETKLSPPMQPFYWDKDLWYSLECVVIENRIKIFVNSVLQFDVFV